MNSVVVLLSLAFVAFVSSVDVTISGTFVAMDSTATYLSLSVSAGASLSQVSFTVTPTDVSIAIFYPNSGTKTNIGSIANGATGYGGFQVLGAAGAYQILINVSYKKGPQFYNSTSLQPLTISNGDGGGSDGKRMVEQLQIESNDVQEITARTGNADFSIEPYNGFAAEEATPIWQYISIISRGPALTQVTYSITPSDNTIGIFFGSNGNAIPNVAANGRGTSNFQMNGNAGWFTFDIRINYRKAGVAYSYTETFPVVIASIGDTSASDGKMAVAGKSNFFPAIAQNNTTVVALAVGGVALIAIVAVVVVVAVVKRQRTTIVA